MFLFDNYYFELTFGTVLGLVMNIVEQIKKNSSFLRSLFKEWDLVSGSFLFPN